ncbi:aKG-HExxH-type peptide beta-hydroxylase [Streptomyces abyssomicinicus]|uniref:aKG-HExxH-type peptide beta-hydroxylase n=1 Tax=Streptomyces abyssomicinicus TaxID=574929 RepID=UPI001FE9DD22|nr:HEXXH motif-containing putative peptide modification protein [Streptomyces abyssomicinicus]
MTEWTAGDRQVFVEASGKFAALWPEMLDELRVGVTQIALLRGRGIEGFTDFTVHGAVFINARRLTSRPGGLPGWLRLADALVHEGTHTRCNAAALMTRFLHHAADEVAPVDTPLRPDPRPLSGLFQQTVVLVRQVMLYRRALESACENDGNGSLAAAVCRRHAKLVAGARQGIGTLGQHMKSLTHDGRSVLAEARDLLVEEETRRPADVAPPSRTSPTASGRGL